MAHIEFSFFPQYESIFLVRAAFPKGVGDESGHLGYEKHHQSDVGREDDC